MSEVEAVRAALAPRGLRERLRLRLAGGWTVPQLAERAGLDEDAVRAALAALGPAVRRRASKVQVYVAGKGHRDVLVDVWRLARRAPGDEGRGAR